MAYTPHTWQANELVTPEKLNAIEIGLGNTISNSGSNTINGNLTAKGIYIDPTNSESNAFLLLRRPEGTNGANINFSRTTSNLQFTLYPTDYEASKNNYCTYYIESAPTGASSSSSRKILSTANIANDLTSTSITDVLSAAMGKQLNDTKLNLSGGTITGTLNIINDHNLYFLRDNDSIKSGFIHNDSNGRFYFYEYPATNTSATDHDNREYYYLPTPDTNRTTTKGFAILTTKNLVTIAQGGTGADTAAAARTNLGITPVNIGALATSGGTMSGGLTTAQLDTTGDVYFHPNNGTTTYLKFSRNNLTSNIMVRLAATAGGQFTIREYPTNNTSENDSASELYYLPTPETNLTSQKKYLILTTRSLITVAQGGTGRSAFTSNKLLCGNGTNAIEELDGVGSSGQFLRSNGNAKPSWVSLTASLIPSLPAEKITSGTIDTARIPNLTRSKITDLKFNSISLPDSSGSSTIDKSGNETIKIPNGRGIIFISRIQNNTREFGIYHIAAGSTIIHHNNGIPQGITVSKSSNTSEVSITLSNTYNTITHRITWILYT